jgi:predicted O-methyltransferase YrrM
VAALADLALARHPGDILEIGARLGTTTCLLAPVARRHGRRVIVIDPWIPGTQDCDGSEYERFLGKTREFQNGIDVWRCRSDAREVFDRMRGRELAFAFVDGLHTYDACMSDFLLVRGTRGLVVADDARYNLEVCLAARIRAREFGWRVVQPRSLKEAYLFKAGTF